MIRYTTPTHEHRVRGIDLTGCDVWVSYEQGMRSLDVKAAGVVADGDDTLVTVAFTQEQTAKFKAGTAQVQINWVYPDGKRDATVKKQIAVDENLLQKVVGYGD